MKKEIEEYLQPTLERAWSGENINMTVAKENISNVPSLYAANLEFKLLFDWHSLQQAENYHRMKSTRCLHFSTT